MRVEVFAVGFGPELFGIDDRHGTRWKFCALPLGGYVKFAGDADVASMSAEGDGPLPPDSFYAKSVGNVRPSRSRVRSRTCYSRQRSSPSSSSSSANDTRRWRSAPCATAALPPSPGSSRATGWSSSTAAASSGSRNSSSPLFQSLGEPITLAVERGGAELEFTVKRRSSRCWTPSTGRSRWATSASGRSRRPPSRRWSRAARREGRPASGR